VGPLQVGATLSRKYRIERLLAESGGVILYEATDTARSQRVWIKILQRDALENADALARFQREAGGAKVLDVGKNDDGLPYMVATEFGAALEKPPAPRTRPPLLGTKSAKSTLPGVAPPTIDPDDEPPPSSEIPLLGDADVLSVETPRPPEPKPKSAPPPRAAAPEPAAPFVSPFAAALRPINDDEDDEDEDVHFDDEAPTRPMPEKKRALDQTNPSIRVLQLLREQERKRRVAAWRWAIALPLVVSASLVGGWYIGHRQVEPVARPTPVAATTDPTESLTAATFAPTDTPTTEPTPVAPMATATAAATATATATPPVEPASSVAEAPTMLPTQTARTTEAPAMLPTHTPHTTKPSHPATRPHHHKTPPSSDPLTL
jgi:hypothetical protein